MVVRECNECGVEFKTYPSRIKTGRGKYCSKKCSDKHTLIKKGQHLSVETQIRKGEKLPEHIHSKQFGRKQWNDKGITKAGLAYKKIKVDGKPKKEHRIVIEKVIGRELHTWEIVHHVNGHKSDNRVENLWLFANTKAHIRHHRGLEYPREDVLFKGGVHKSP